MSAQEQGQGEPPLGEIALTVVDGIYTLSVYDDATLVSEAASEEEAQTVVDRIIVGAQKNLSPRLAQVVADTWGVVEQAWDEGEITYQDTAGFFDYVRYNLYVPVLTAAAITSGWLADRLLEYAESKGYVPPVASGKGTAPIVPAPPQATPSPTPTPAPLPPPVIPAVPIPPITVQASGPTTTASQGQGPAPAPAPAPTVPVVGPGPAPIPSTPGGALVTSAQAAITPDAVTFGGFTAQQAAAVQEALYLDYNNLLAVQAAVADGVLGGLLPGQAAQLINTLQAGIDALREAVTNLDALTGNVSSPSLVVQLTGLTATQAAQALDITTLQGQVAEQDPSALYSSVESNTSAIGTLTAAVGAFESTATARMDNFEQQFAMTEPSIMSDELAQVAGTANNAESLATENAAKLALTTDECLAALCDAENSVTDPIQEGGATPSLLRQLGGLLGKVFELGLVAAVVDTFITVLDWQVGLDSTVWDVTEISGWATRAASAIMADTSWGGAILGPA